jgi:hypothetical protein
MDPVQTIALRSKFVGLTIYKIGLGMFIMSKMMSPHSISDTQDVICGWLLQAFCVSNRRNLDLLEDVFCFHMLP